jgi:hypothetical protein
MTETEKTTNLEVGTACLQGILIRLGLSAGLLALALALASRFS